MKLQTLIYSLLAMLLSFVSQAADHTKPVEHEKSSPQTALSAVLAKGDIVLGDKNAKNVIIEYSSLSCGGCAEYHAHHFPDIKRDFIDTGIAAYIYRDISVNRAALTGASLVYCLYKDHAPQIFYSKVDMLFKNQDSWVFNNDYQSSLKDIMILNGEKESEYNRCINDARTFDMFLERAHVAISNGEYITPRLIVNGTHLDGVTVGHVREAINK